jgi:hypothetical protein
VHVLDIEGDGAATTHPLDPEVKPSPVVVFRMVGANPNVVLHKWGLLPTRSWPFQRRRGSRSRNPS